MIQSNDHIQWYWLSNTDMIKHLRGIGGYYRKRCKRQAVTATSLGATSLIPSVRMLVQSCMAQICIDGQMVETAKTTWRTWMDIEHTRFFDFFLNPIVHCNATMPWHRKSSPFKSTGRSEVLPKLQLENPCGFRQKYGPVREQTLGIFVIWVIYGSSCIFEHFSFHLHSHLVRSFPFHHELMNYCELTMFLLVLSINPCLFEVKLRVTLWLAWIWCWTRLVIPVLLCFILFPFVPIPIKCADLTVWLELEQLESESKRNAWIMMNH